MKKVLIAILAVVSLASCSNEETIVQPEREAIGFGTPFVENSTRADYSSSNIKEFNVYGTVNGIALFGGDGAVVSRGEKAYGIAWDCSEAEYWIPGAKYVFEAVVDGTISEGKIAYTIGANPDNDGVNDLLYATKTVESAAADQGLVEFNFTHLLSKVYFNFVNNSTSDNYKFEISNITISGAKASGEYSITDKKWTSVSEGAVETPFSFGSVANTIEKGASAPSPSANACLFIPGAQTLTVSFTQKTYSGNKLMGEDTITAPLSTSFDANGCYIIKVSLSAGMPISFTVEQDGLSGWDNKTDISIP